jgi:hypothetical protein
MSISGMPRSVLSTGRRPRTRSRTRSLVPALAAEFIESIKPNKFGWFFPSAKDPSRPVSHGTLYSFMWRQRDRASAPWRACREWRIGNSVPTAALHAQNSAYRSRAAARRLEPWFLRDGAWRRAARPLVADLAAHGAGLGEAGVMGFARHALADEAGGRCHEPAIRLVAQAFGC